MSFVYARPCGPVGSMFDTGVVGAVYDTWSGHILFAEIDINEIFYMVIYHLPLSQEGQLR